MTAPAPGFEIATETRPRGAGELAVVRVSGEIDLANADELAAALGASQCREAAGVVLDLSGVPFMDSSGLAVVLTATQERNRDFAVVVAENSAVARLFRVAGIEPHVQIAPSESAALDFLAEGNADG